MNALPSWLPSFSFYMMDTSVYFNTYCFAFKELGEMATPISELDYWNRRALDLTKVVDQLKGPGVVVLSAKLKAAGSTYFAALER